MNDYVLNKKPESASNETVWAFDLGNVPRPSDGRDARPRFGWRAATGEGCDWPDEFPSPRWGDLSRLGNGERSSAEPKARSGPSERARVSQRGRSPDEVNPIPQFLHKASQLIPAEFALPRGRECCACLRRPRSRVLPRGETKTAAGRRRMWRTRQAHGSHRPSPARGGILVAASGKEAPGRSSAAVPGCGCGWRLAASSIAGRDARPTRRRDACATMKSMQAYLQPLPSAKSPFFPVDLPGHRRSIGGTVQRATWL